LLGRIDAREVTEWQAYERVAGPLGDARLDALFAQLLSLTANVNRPKRQRPYRPEQFMPKWDPEAPPERRPEMSGEDILRAVKGMQRSMSRRGRNDGNAGRPAHQDQDQ
jgi:hypothetical protein